MTKILGRCIGGCYWLAVFVFAVLAIFALSVKQLLPYLDHYRPQIESNLEQITGYPVTLESIDGRLEGIDPTVSVFGLHLQANGQTAVAIDEVRVRLDTIKSLFTLSPQFTYIRFVHPIVSLQEANGKWRLKGARPTRVVNEDVGIERILDYLAAQRNFSILDAKLLISSDQFGNHNLAIPTTYIFQKARESFLTASLYLDEDTRPFKLDAKIVDTLSLFSGYRVKASIQAPMFSVPLNSAIASVVPDLSSLQFGGNIWLDFRVGKEIDLQLESTQISVSFLNGEHYQASPSIKLRYAQKNPSLHVDVHNLRIKDQLDHSYPTTNMSYEWNVVTKRSNIGFDRFDMGLAHRIGNHFLPSDWQASTLLNGLSPQGMAENASLHLWRDKEDLSFQYLSNLVSASVNGYQGIPHASNINAVFSLSDDSGYIDFTGRDSEIQFDTVFNRSWEMDSLAGYVDWHNQQDALVVSGRDLKINRKGSSIDGGFRLEVRKDQPDWLSLNLHGQHISLEDRLTYIPPKALNTTVTDWIQDAFVGKGSVDSLDVLVQTELMGDSVPHVRIQMDVNDLDVAFDKKWPVAKQVKGTFEFDQKGVAVNIVSAVLQNLPLSNVLLSVPISSGSANWLNLKGAVNEESSLLLKTLRATPLAETVLLPFKTWQMKGDVNGRFDISIPFSDGVLPTVNLTLNFSNNVVLNIADIDIDSRIQKGQINYSSSKGITDSEFDFEVLGGDAHLVLSSTQSANDELVVMGDLSGVADLHEVAKWREIPHQLATRISGLAGYSGKLLVNQSQADQVDFTLSSDLQGGVIDFPFPIGKLAADTKSLTIKLQRHGQDLIMDQDYDSFMRSRILIRKGRFMGGELMLNNNLPLNSEIPKGLVVKGGLEQLDIEQWQGVIKDLSSITVETNASPKPPQWLQKMDIIIDKLKVNELNVLHNFKANFQSAKNSPMRVSSDEMSFLLTDHEDGLDLHFDFLSWNTATSEPAEKNSKESPIHAAQIPNMTLSIDQLYINENPYGDWQLKIAREGNQIRLDPIRSQLKTGTLKGHIFWQDEGDNSSVEFVLEAGGTDLAELTKKFSSQSYVTSKKYNLNLALNWKGHPFYFDRQSVVGTIDFNAQSGNFSQVDEQPAFLKVLGIFNLGVLTKRLALDFSDVYQSGLSFDELKGVLSLEGGGVNHKASDFYCFAVSGNCG